MTDQELRDKLASEYSPPLHPACDERDQLRAQVEALKAENSNLQNNYTEAKSTARHTIDQLRAEVAQLKRTSEIYKDEASRHAETAVTAFETVAQLKAELTAEKNYSAETAARLELALKEYAEYVRGKPGAWYVTQLQAENDHLKAQCEKLYLTGDKIGGWMSAALDDESVCAEMKADIHPFLEALAEYRAMKKE